MGPMGRLARTGPAFGSGALARAARSLRVPRWRGRPGADGGAATRAWPSAPARGRTGADGDPVAPARWEVVTVDRPPEQVLPDGRWPEPLRRLGGAIEVRVRPAPGDRGTELAARPLVGGPAPAGLAAHLVGDDPALLVRRTLRQVKQRVEAGEVLRADRSALDRPGVRG
ncbi:hypothetical protein [Micromonospora sp. WMMD1155]|uniref:hypothetical protein n=1 Tax=Micromonospora sp. WMMD1155 TaxID=3016094 RepID=UPI00249C0124|nr:hypothetical protein [Micromonospora sp. WMMD1155]WFE52432.1 hypothetical protein O7617_19845 [Micromonospora sp. WMMD1155]